MTRNTSPLAQVLQLEKLSIVSDSNDVLLNADAQFHSGQLHVIYAKNGAGKTSLLETLAGLRPLQAGKVIINGSELWLQGKRKRKLNIQAILKVSIQMQQSEKQWFANRAREEFAYSLKPYRLSKEEQNKRISEAMQLLQLDEQLLEQDPWLLSGGQQRRLALALTYACKPEWLLLDEPLSGLDADARKALQIMITALLQEGTGVIAVSHQLEPLRSLASGIWTIENKSLQTLVVAEQEEPGQLAGKLLAAIMNTDANTQARKDFLAGELINTGLVERKAATIEPTKQLLPSKKNVDYGSLFDPRALMISYMIISFAILLQQSIGPIVMAGMVGICVVWPVRKLVRPLLPAIRGMVILTVTLVGVSGLRLHPFSFDLEAGAQVGIRMASLIVIMLYGLPVMVLMTPFRLKRAIEQTFGRLEKIGVPIAPFGMLIMLIFRFIPMLATEWDRFGKLIKARGKITSRFSVNSATVMFIPFIRSIIAQAEETAEALELRGYGRMQGNPVYGFILRMGRRDVMLIFISIIGCMLLLLLARITGH